jgi:hypothetical protein
MSEGKKEGGGVGGDLFGIKKLLDALAQKKSADESTDDDDSDEKKVIAKEY